MALHGINISFLVGFEADLISFIMASEVAFFRARDWADFWVLKGICGRNGDWFLEGGRESGFETLVIALNPSWIIIVSIRERPAESLRGFLTEGRVETFWERTDFLDRALEPWFCRYTFYWGGSLPGLRGVGVCRRSRRS
jgi:hypothetical protein